MQFKTLTKDNYVMYAMKAYDNPQCSCLGEFDNDLARITYIKRLFKKYISTDILKERLIINHIVIMTNVFGTKVTARLLFFCMEEYYYAMIKTFLLYLNRLPLDDELIKNETNLNLSDITIMDDVVKILRGLE